MKRFDEGMEGRDMPDIDRWILFARVLVAGEERCSSFDGVIDPVNRASTVCSGFRFFIDQTDTGDNGVFVMLD